MDIQNILDAQGKENMDLANRMRNYKDPLLAAFDEEEQTKSDKKSKTTAADDSSEDTEGDSSSSGSSDDEPEVTIKFPKNSAQDLHQFISRDLTNI